ncbi:MAG: hypothetical protein VX304_02690 [Planctomycetota bacterium]|nr:hypothetical protein [Planctomycetota bacterium]
MPNAPSGVGRWVCYALGGGMGHLARTLSLIAALRRHPSGDSVSVHLLTNSPFASDGDWHTILGGDDQLTRIPAHLDAESTRRMVCESLSAEQSRFQRPLLMVDTFPRGLGGELADVISDWPGQRVLVHRDLSPEYLDWADGLDRQVREFSLLLVPGEPAAFDGLPQARRTAPWLWSLPLDCNDRNAARRRLHLAGEKRPVVLVAGTGNREDIDHFAGVADTLDQELGHDARVVFASLPGVPLGRVSRDVSEIRLWPLVDVLNGVDVLVAAGGYNTVQEARGFGCPLVGWPRERRYDQQDRRLTELETVAGETEMIERVSQHLSQPATKMSAPVQTNGAVEAVEILFEMFGSDR